MADNESTIRDEDGDYSDWIEIANLSDSSIDLTGWGLTDDYNNPFKWIFPEVILNSGQYLIVFASGKNRTNVNQRLHTNFALNKSGEFVGLFSIYGGYIDTISNYPSLPADVSYGKMTENPFIVGYFLKPTPGGKNTAVGEGFTDEPIFSASGGVFKESFYLQINTLDSNAVLYYTVDGTEPSAGSYIYQEPILITTDRVWIVSAYSIKDKYLPSKIHTECYIPLNDDMLSFTSSLPIVVIEKLDNYPFSYDSWQKVYAAIYNSGSTMSQATNPATLLTKARIKIRGTTSTNQPKNNFAVEWINECGNEKKIETLGMPADSEWVLYAPNNYDTPLIHNAFMYELSNQLGRYAPRFKFVELFIHDQNIENRLSYSSYNGVYLLVEKIKRSKNRVNVEKLEPEFSEAPMITGGYIFKKDWPDRDESIFSAGGENLMFVYPDGREMTQPERALQKQYLIQYLDNFYNVLYSDNFTDKTNGYAAFIDVGSWIDYHLLNTLAFNVDALNLSTYFYKPRNGKLFCGPVWDFDRSMDSRDDPRDDNPFTWWTYVENLGHNYFGFIGNVWWSRLFQDPDFWQGYIDRYQTLRQNVFSVSNLWQLVDFLSAQLKEAQPREFQRWGDFTAPRNNSYQYEIQYMKEWISNRVSFLDTNFLSPPVIYSQSGIVPAGFRFEIFSADSDTVYFTTDGTDPRLSGGAISPLARTLKNRVFVVGRNIKLIARAYDAAKVTTIIENQMQIPSPWSSPVCIEFVVIPDTVNNDDSDNDGLPDWWESEFGLDYYSNDGEDGASGDPDGDGITNLEEYLSNSNPRDPVSKLNLYFSSLQNHESATLSFKALPLRIYTIEFSPIVYPPLWKRLIQIPPPEKETDFFINIPIQQDATMFFRLVSEIIR